MTLRREVADTDGLYATISAASQPTALMRDNIDRLGRTLARATRDAPGVVDLRDVLCVFILRGGALLYPSFAAEFGSADFCMLGLRRDGGEVSCDYRTSVPRASYDLVLYVDCIAGTGGTILAAHRAIAEVTDAAQEIAAVICSATTATRVLDGAGIGMIGFSLDEAEDNGLVLPDLGKLDAGDLFTGIGIRPLVDHAAPSTRTG